MCNETLFRYCTTELLVLVADVSPDVVKTMSRQSSDSFRRFWCSLGEIALNHVWNLPAASQMHISDLGLLFTHHLPFAMELREVFHSPIPSRYM